MHAGSERTALLLVGALIQGCWGNNGSAKPTPLTTATLASAVSPPVLVGPWSVTSSLPTKRSAHASASYNGFLYVTGGSSAGPGNGASFLSDVLYAPLNANGTVGAWKSTSALPAARAGHTAAIYSSGSNAWLYVLGGRAGSGAALADIQSATIKADGTLGAWTTIASRFDLPRFGHASAVLNGSNGSVLYVIGGTDGTKYFGDVQMASFNSADGTLGSWKFTGQPLPSAREGHAAVIVQNSSLYIVGGGQRNSGGVLQALTEVQVARVNSDGTLVFGWTPATQLPLGRAYHASFTTNGLLFVIGGDDFFFANQTFDWNDVEAAPINTGGASLGTWGGTVPIPAPRGYASATVSGSNLVLIGGYDGSSGSNSDVWTAPINAGGAAVNLAPGPVSLSPKGGQTFTASAGSGAGYAWAFSSNACCATSSIVNGDQSQGTINASSGAYVAGSIGSVTDVVQVTDSLGQVAYAQLSLSAGSGGAGLAISPTSVNRPPRGTQIFTTSGSTGTVTFLMKTNASGGSVDNSGKYTVGSTGNVTDIVQASDGSGASVTATVSVGAGVSISPPSLTVAAKGTGTLTASGGSGLGYVWSLSPAPSGGGIDSNGNYTAGAIGGVIDVVKVVDSFGNSASANITVTAGGTSSLSVSPANPSVAPRGALHFSSVGGTGAGTSWSLSTNRSGGNITASGDYTAGAASSVIDVISVSDSSGASATTSVTVGAGVSIAPSVAAVSVRSIQKFSASGGSGTGYVWSLFSKPSGGSIDQSGNYTAGATAGVTDVAQVVDSLLNSASANVTVTAEGTVLAIAPATFSLPPLGKKQFTASGGSGTGQVWTLSTNSSGGTIDNTGYYISGTTANVSDTIKLTDSLGDSAMATVAVGPGVTISSATVTVLINQAHNFTAQGGSGTGYVWSIATNKSGGSINPQAGVYIAGPMGGTSDFVAVTDSFGNTATAKVFVTNTKRVSTSVFSCACQESSPDGASLLLLLCLVRLTQKRRLPAGLRGAVARG